MPCLSLARKNLSCRFNQSFLWIQATRCAGQIGGVLSASLLLVGQVHAATPVVSTALPNLVTAPAVSAELKQAPPLPKVDNRAFVVMDGVTGQVLASKSPHLKAPPASLTKLMTSFLIEQAIHQRRLQPNQLITLQPKESCLHSPVESCMKVKPGQAVSVDLLLQGLIVTSGNDAARMLARHSAGNEAQFVEWMNRTAQQLGMQNTHFHNPTGLGDSLHRSTAYDLARLSRAVIYNAKGYWPLYGQQKLTFNGLTQINRNQLLARNPEVDGLKTGYTRAAGYCIAATAHRAGQRLIVIILGAPSTQARTVQASQLLAWGFQAKGKGLPQAKLLPQAATKPR